MKKPPLPTKREDKDIERFISYLKTFGVNAKIIDKPDETHSGNWDYTLFVQKENKKLSVEITQVKEKEFLQFIQWGNTVKAFQLRFKQLLQKEKYRELKGVWCIRTPALFGFSKQRARSVAEKHAVLVLQAIVNNQAFVDIEGFQLALERTTKDGRGVYFSTLGNPRFFDSAEEIIENIKRLLPEENLQLKNKVGEGIIILENNNRLADLDGYIRALSMIRDTLKLENCDKIYLEVQENNFVMIYSRKFKNIWFRGKGSASLDLEFLLPTETWIKYTEVLSENPDQSIRILKRLLSKNKVHEIFPDSFAREKILRFMERLIGDEKFEEAMGFIDKFIDDPDPEEPENYRGDPKFNYHELITKGQDLRFITTVLGHLAWVVEKLTLRKKYIHKALNYTKKLLPHKNLYVKLQAIIPLTEIAGRRQWLDGYGKRPREGPYKEFHRLVFALVKLVKENPNYKAIARQLAHIFFYYKDLSTEEAEEVLNALKVTDESAGLFIYFGIFRQKHYKKQDIEFDTKKLNEKLKEIIKDRNEKYNRLRASIAWHLWKILDENRDEFDTIKPYIDLFLQQPYQREIYAHIGQIITDWIKDNPEVCIQWFKLMLDQISKLADREKQKVWLRSAEEVIETVAKHEPSELLEAMEKLVHLWAKGAFIGSHKRLFGTFRLVLDEKQKEEIKIKFQEWHGSMRRLNPKLESVDFT